MYMNTEELIVTIYCENSHFFTDIGECSCQYSVGTCLSTKRLSHDHKAMPNNHHFIDLEYLLEEDTSALQVHPGAYLPDGWVQGGVVWLWQLDAREQIRCDASKEGQIMRQKLGKIHISDRTQHQNVLILIRVLELRQKT